MRSWSKVNTRINPNIRAHHLVSFPGSRLEEREKRVSPDLQHKRDAKR